ncbi:holin [Escherichia phage AV119]|nr:holin [Escherichia phage AV119]WPK36576.1 holin [Escherichia phage AV120]
MAAPRISFSPSDILFGVLDRLFKDNATGKVLASRVAVVILLFMMAIVWYRGDSFFEYYKQSKYETYSEIIEKERNARFESVALEQLQIVHISSEADFSAVYSFRPKNLNYFVDIIAYEGKLPSTISEKSLGGYPVDKTMDEYTVHLNGRHYYSDSKFAFLPTKKPTPEINYMYSCPYFNLDNIYAGTITMYWYRNDHISNDRLESICSQAARILGRAK